MANLNPLPKQAQHGKELVQRTRAGILNAFDAVESRGKPLSELLADAFIDNPLKFMDTVSKFMPKEINLDVQHSGNASQLTDSEIADEIATRARQRLTEAKDITEQSEVTIADKAQGHS